MVNVGHIYRYIQNLETCWTFYWFVCEYPRIKTFPCDVSVSVCLSFFVLISRYRRFHCLSVVLRSYFTFEHSCVTRQLASHTLHFIFIGFLFLSPSYSSCSCECSDSRVLWHFLFWISFVSSALMSVRLL